MGSASLAAARPTARPPARTVTTIPLQPGGLRGKNEYELQDDNSEKNTNRDNKNNEDAVAAMGFTLQKQTVAPKKPYASDKTVYDFKMQPAYRGPFSGKFNFNPSLRK